MSELLKGLHAHIIGILSIQNSSVSGRVRFNRSKRAISDMYDYCLQNVFSDDEAKQATDWIGELQESMRGGGWQVAKCIDVLQAFELKS
jgi:hypothetical protein|tara:strand:- start:238 stop:504 length:267 start_codon:yes stop_codon:yes gene_type:complete